MNVTKTEQGYKVRETHFPVSIFAATLGALLAVAGIHFWILKGLQQIEADGFLMKVIIILYWNVVAVGFTVLTRWQIRRSYEIPMQEMAKAANAVAHGDFSVYLSPLHTAEKLDYLDVMIMDFNKMVEELGSIETLKTDFFSNVSHEIKTPISVILSSAEMLKNTDLKPEEQQGYVGTIIQSSKKLSELITNILKINKLEKQNIQPVVDEYDLCEQLATCALQFEEAWEKKKIEFEAEIEDRAMIEADESLLELVWTNLLSNAVKFTQPGGKILLKQTSTEDEVIVSVSDTGCGMSQETKKHIYDKFYQADTSHATEGNGLGLALAFRIVQMLDGVITVESKLGQGTTFCVRIPVCREKEWQEEEA